MNNQDDFQDDFFDDLISDEAEMSDFERNEDEDDDFVEDDDAGEVRTVLLAKNEMLALLGLKKSAAAGIIVRVDPRQPLPSAQRYDNIESAVEWFDRSLATSRKNGWEVIFDGQPLYG